MGDGMATIGIDGGSGSLGARAGKVKGRGWAS